MNAVLRNLIPFKVAAGIIIGLNVAVIVFHALVLAQVIPFNVIWGGRLKSLDQMYRFEAVSVLINVLLIIIVIAKARHRGRARTGFLNIMLWLFAAVFMVNTLGNLAAETSAERYIATPLTALLAVLCWRMAIERTQYSGAAV